MSFNGCVITDFILRRCAVSIVATVLTLSLSILPHTSGARSPLVLEPGALAGNTKLSIALGALHGATHVDVLPAPLTEHLKSKSTRRLQLQPDMRFGDDSEVHSHVSLFAATHMQQKTTNLICGDLATLRLLGEAPYDPDNEVNQSTSNFTYGCSGVDLGLVFADCVTHLITARDRDEYKRIEIQMRQFYWAYQESFKQQAKVRCLQHDMCLLSTRWSQTDSGSSVRTAKFIADSDFLDAVGFCGYALMQRLSSKELPAAEGGTNGRDDMLRVSANLLRQYAQRTKYDGLVDDLARSVRTLLWDTTGRLY